MNILQDIFRGGWVRRYHTDPSIHEQTVGHHSWGVAVIIDQLWPDASKDLLRAALYHDAAEGEFGDIPAPAKLAMSDAARTELHDAEAAWEEARGIYVPQYDANDLYRLKCADYLELVARCQREKMMGNSLVARSLQNGVDYIDRWARELPEDEQERVHHMLMSILGKI